jgi:hypothetical protein
VLDSLPGMAQRRNSSGREDERRSDLTDVKALAAKARSETGGPVLRQNPSELSGVRPRRDSVIGMRLTPPPRATRSELPSWFWGALGCLSVLLVGFVGLFVLGRSGKLGPLLGEGSPLAAVVQAPAAPAAGVEVAPIAPEPAPAPTEPAAKTPASREHAERLEREHARAAAERAAAEAAAPAPAAPAPADVPPTDPNAAAPAPPTAAAAPTAAPAADDATGAAKQGARVAAATSAPTKVRAAKASDAPGAADQGDQGDNAAGDSTDTKTDTKAGPARPAPTKASAKSNAAAAADDSDDDASLPGQDAVEAALDKLATQVRGCFVKYQIKGTARVRLVATPAGTAESVNVTGDFEDTPTGLCVESVVGGAKLPTFKGAPLKLSQSYQLR